MKLTIKNSNVTKVAGIEPQATFKKVESRTKNTKKEAILKIFIERGELGINCFESANMYHDYVLRTTVSDLSHGVGGIQFMRKWEKVPNAFGKQTDCVRYWLDELNISKAQAYLGINIQQGGN